MHLTLNVLLSLLIQAKRTGKGKIGNGRMLVMLLQVIADSVHPELSAERNMLQVFSDEPVKSRAYQKIDKQLGKFIPSGKPYPYEQIRFSKFEQAIGNIQRYSSYLMKMQQCCEELLDPKKTESLIYTILEILRVDSAYSDILYDAQYIPKEMLFGTPAHPKKICPAALLLGLLYQVHQNPDICECNIALMKTPYLLQFHLVSPSGSYRDRTDALTALLNPNAPVSLEQSICKTASKMSIPVDSGEIYPLDLRDQNGNKADIPERGHIFLYGQGGSGKTTYLSQMKTENTCFMLPLFQYKTSLIASYQPEISSRILLQILLKYHYQNCCRTYDACAAAEGADTVLRQLHELEKLLSIQPVNGLPNYTLMLDGINEVQPDERSALLDEIGRICKEWHNVRLIVSGRSIPPAPLFQRFHAIEVCGITDDALNAIVPVDTPYRNLLKTPLFLHIYRSANQESPLNRADLTERYVNRLIESVHDKSAQPMLRFLVLYVLPFAANHMAQRQRMFLERADLADAIDRAADIFVNDERIYQNTMFPQQITKKSLHFGSDKDELIDWIVSQISLLQTDPADTKILYFSHQYFRDFFAAKYIVNLLNALHIGYKNTPEQLADLFHKYGLGHLWYPEEMREIYRLIGEFAGDDCNQADDDFVYQETILDTALDWSRQFDTFRATENIIRTMAEVRNNVICGVNFSGTTLPLYLPCNLKFSRNGEDACDFIGAHVSLIGLIDGNICCMTKSPDGTKILLALEDQYALMLDEESKAVLHEYDFSEENSPWCEFDTVVFSQDSQTCALVLNGNNILIDVQTGEIIRNVKPLCDYGITLPDDIPYADKQPIAALGIDFLTQLYRNLPHFRGCDFTDAVFLMEDTKAYLLDLGGRVSSGI